MKKRVGISAISFYFPRHYVSLEELLLSRGEEPGRAIKGLGAQRMAVLANNEDSVSMAANAIRTLDYSNEEIGKLIFATECGVDSSKDNASYLHELIGLPENCEAYDIKAACAASTYGLWQVIDWILSGRNKGKLGLVVCSDRAVYEHRTGAEITGGSGAVALLIEENPNIISFDLEVGDYKKGVRDFWKPLDSECAIIAGNGKFSIDCYLDALEPSFENFVMNGGTRDFDYLIFHTPYAKMVWKAFDILSKKYPEIQGKFESMTADSLKAPALVGNIYNGALYLAMASLLEQQKNLVRGKSIGFYSFGSGCSSKFFRGVVNHEFESNFNLFKQFDAMKKITPEKYEQLRLRETILEETKGFILNGIDKYRYRQYVFR